MASIDKSSVDNNSYYKSINTDNLEDIWDGIYVHPNINEKYSRWKIRDHIRQSKYEWKGAELSAKNTGKGLHKLFKTVVNYLKN